MHIKNGVSSDTLASLQLAGNISEETLKKNVARFNKKVKDFKAKRLVTMRLEDWIRMYQKKKERFPEDGSRPLLCRYIISRGWFCVKSLSLLPGGVPEQDRV